MADAQVNIKISYFGVAGRAEVAKLCCALGGIAFDEDSFDGNEWKKRKLQTMWGSAPYATLEDGTVIGQSRALSRYFAKRAGLYPTCPVLAAKVDSVYDFCEDILKSTSKNEESLRKADWAEAGPMRSKWMAMEKFIEGEYTVGKCLTMADICVFVFATNVTSGFFDHYPSAESAFANMPKIQAVCKMVGSLKQVQDRYAQDFPGKDRGFAGFIKNASLGTDGKAFEKGAEAEPIKVEGIPVITYFAAPGRAEIARVMYDLAGVAFEDKFLGMEEWGNLKKSGTIPLGNQLPTLTLNGEYMTQSLAWTRYVAKVCGYYPEDALEAQKADAVVDALQDVGQAAYKAKMEGDASSVWGEEGKCTTLMGKLEKFVSSHDEAFAVSGSMTLADVAIFAVCASLGNNDAVGKFEKISKIREAVLKTKDISARYKKHEAIERFKQFAEAAGISL